jgi:ATP-dependent DNA helicase RecQ
LGLAEALRCRRQKLLGYFGEEAAPCGNCDLCDTPADVFDGTTVVRKALSAVLRTEEWFGSGHLIDILLGADNERIRAKRHDQLSVYGCGKEFGKRQWQAVFRQMMGHDLLRPDPERHGALRFTEAALPILRGEQSIELRRDTIKSAERRPAVKALVSEEDAPLLSALKAKRRALAEAQKVPAYVIFPDRTLIEMAETRPQTLDQMARISGVGAKKLERYGDDFLSVITGAVEQIHPARRKLAGRNAGSTYDQLLEAQAQLARGDCGTLKPLTCSASLLAKVAQMRADDETGITRLLGERRAERFAQAFLDVLRGAG